MDWDEHEIKFSPNQKLPDGYKVIWFEGDEHYHWIRDNDLWSDCFSSRWQAYKSAWFHCRKNYT